MLTFLILAVIAAAVFGFAGLVISAVIWLILLPIRLFFRLVFGAIGLVFGLLGSVFGIGGSLLGLIIGPVIGLIVVVAVVGALVAAVTALLAPLVPVALLALLAWAIFKLFGNHTTPASV